MEQKLARVKAGANMGIGREYLQCAISNFKATKKQGTGTFSIIIRTNTMVFS